MNTTERLKLRLKLLKDLKENDGYVKGFGPKLCRVMDKDHNPLYNINREIVMGLVDNDKLKLEGLIFKINLES